MSRSKGRGTQPRRVATTVRRRGPSDTQSVARYVEQGLSESTLVGCLVARGRQPDKVAFWLEGIEQAPVKVTRERLLDEVTRVACGLRCLQVGTRDRVLIVLPTSVEFVTFFFGALFAGATPVPAYPPAGWQQLTSFAANIGRMTRVAGARLVVVPEPLRDLLADSPNDGLGAIRVVTPEEVLAADNQQETLPTVADADDLALIQFSSGSTGEPRGVCLSHRNVLSNSRGFLTRMMTQPDDVCVSWLPLYHDMGLIGTMLATLMLGMPMVMFPPTDFLRQPDFWLRVIGKYRATLSVAPHFAYNLCVRKADPAALPGVDLSSLRVLLNGAEPIRAEGIRAFQERFRVLGLRPGVVTPCYGLAEGTLAACMRRPGLKPQTAGPASISGNFHAAAPTRADARTEVVSVGPPLDGVEVGIREPGGDWLPDKEIGEICIRGPSVCRGYISQDGLMSASTADGWLHTGDLGFRYKREFYVTGRLKDLIIIGGRNLQPHDLEAVAAELPGLRPGRIAAFGVSDSGRATEVLVVVAEAVGMSSDEAAGLVSQFRQQLLNRFGVTPYDIVVVGRGEIPLTSSGKLRRSQARVEYERNAFREVVYRLRPPSATRGNGEAITADC